MDNGEKKPSLVKSVRFMLSIVCFFLNAILYMQRVNLSVAIVCMVNKINCMSNAEQNKSISLSDNSNFSIGNQSFVSYHGNQSSTICSEENFNWSKKVQGIILGTFFIGQLTTQVIGGWISLYFGPKIVLEISMICTSVFTLLSPVAARYSYLALIAMRFFIGVAQGCVSSSLNVFWNSWTPPLERSTLLSISNSGTLMGNAIAFLIGGILCETQTLGWPSIFYITGSLGIVWGVLWIFVASDSPETHTFIKEKEKIYIVSKTSETILSSKEKKNVPWKQMFKSKAVLGLIITTLSSNFGISLLTTFSPTYMNEILKFDIRTNGELLSIPFLTCWLSVIISAVLSDKLIQSEKLSKLTCRRLFNTIGFFVPVLSFFGLIFVTSSAKFIGFTLLLVNITFSGITYGAGYLVNFNDIGGCFSGIIYGVANTIAISTSVLAPILVGNLTPNKTREEWKIVFIISIAVYVVGILAFLFFSDSDTQSWAKAQNKTSDLKIKDEQADEQVPLNSNQNT